MLAELGVEDDGDGSDMVTQGMLQPNGASSITPILHHFVVLVTGVLSFYVSSCADASSLGTVFILLNSAIAELQAADTFFFKETSITPLRTSLISGLASKFMTRTPTRLIPRSISIHMFPQIPTSVMVRALGLCLREERCQWSAGLLKAQPHLLGHYDLFLQACNHNNAGYDLELEARHAYHNMRQSEVQDTMLYIQQ
ncbi:hypothetical protein RI367_008801 [Sorochytrium milnesiophthora]